MWKVFVEIFIILIADFENDISEVYDSFINKHSRELCTFIYSPEPNGRGAD